MVFFSFTDYSAFSLFHRCHVHFILKLGCFASYVPLNSICDQSIGQLPKDWQIDKPTKPYNISFALVRNILIMVIPLSHGAGCCCWNCNWWMDYQRYRQKTNVHIMALYLASNPLTHMERRTKLELLVPPPPLIRKWWNWWHCYTLYEYLIFGQFDTLMIYFSVVLIAKQNDSPHMMIIELPLEFY